MYVQNKIKTRKSVCDQRAYIRLKQEKILKKNINIETFSFVTSDITTLYSIYNVFGLDFIFQMKNKSKI